MHWSLKCGKKMAALCDESVEEHQLADPADVTGQNSWNASQTRMLIQHFKENAILWDKRLKDNGNKAKTKKTMAPLIARFGNTQPPRGLKEIKSRWHSLRSSVLRYMKKRKEDPEYEVKWTFGETWNSFGRHWNWQGQMKIRASGQVKKQVSPVLFFRVKIC